MRPQRQQPTRLPRPWDSEARTLEWVAISFSNAWKWKVKVKSFSRVRLLATSWTAAYQTPLSMDFPGKSTGVGCHCLLWIGTYISIITLNVNGLNASTKRYKVAEWIQKQDPYICCLQETHFRSQDTCRLKVRGWKNIFHENGEQKKAEVAILISDKIDLKIKNITRDKEGHYIMIKG